MNEVELSLKLSLVNKSIKMASVARILSRNLANISRQQSGVISRSVSSGIISQKWNVSLKYQTSFLKVSHCAILL